MVRLSVEAGALTLVLLSIAPAVAPRVKTRALSALAEPLQASQIPIRDVAARLTSSS